MARLNPKRRRALALTKALVALAKSRNPSLVADSGHIRSSAKAHKVNEAFGVPLYSRKPKPVNYDGQGKEGRIVRGKIIPKRKKVWSNS
jgi:hypothetical protein